jgi:hypothetical protein
MLAATLGSNRVPVGDSITAAACQLPAPVATETVKNLHVQYFDGVLPAPGNT